MSMHTVLVIDDDLGTRDGFGRILQIAGFEVATAPSGHEALVMAKTRPFSAILCDLRLPDMSGNDVLRALRAQCVNVPLVVVTAFGSVASAAEAFKLGALDYVEKPLPDDDLIELVTSAINASATRASAHHTPSEIPRNLSNLPTSIDPRVTAASQAIERRFGEFDLSLADISREVDLSVGHFSLLLKSETGYTFLIHLHKRRVIEARKRLEATLLPVKEIAFRVGYRSTRQLDRHFLRFCGLTPMAYRRSFWQGAAVEQRMEDRSHSIGCNVTGSLGNLKN
jgi:YesN/AraC family two-component response regulator